MGESCWRCTPIQVSCVTLIIIYFLYSNIFYMICFERSSFHAISGWKTRRAAQCFQSINVVKQNFCRMGIRSSTKFVESHESHKKLTDFQKPSGSILYMLSFVHQCCDMHRRRKHCFRLLPLQTPHFAQVVPHFEVLIARKTASNYLLLLQ